MLRDVRDKRTLVVLTLLIAAGGGALFEAVGAPAGWIAGSMLAVAVAALSGLEATVPLRLRDAVFLFLGIYVGSGVSRQTLEQIVTWPVSFAILAVSIAAIITSSYLWLHFVGRWDRLTALLAGLPGALSFVLAAAEAVGADMRKVAVNQSVRLLILVELLPLAVFAANAERVSNVATPPLAITGTIPLADVAILIGAGALGGLAVARTGLPGGLMLGGLLTSATLYLTGFVEAPLPRWLFVPAVVCLGAVAGSRFRPGDAKVLRSIAPPVLITFAMSMTIAAAAAALVSMLLGIDFPQALIAFAPGALDALTVLAFTLEMDPAYVAAHHVVRFVGLAITIPFVAQRIARRVN